MPTIRDLIALTLKDAGVVGIGQTPQAEDTNDALTRLNQMLYQWQVKRWLVFHLVTLSKTATGAQSYTVGPGGDFNISVRPDKLEAPGNFIRQLSGAGNEVDYGLKLIDAREEYNQISLKSLSSFPQAVFYEATLPLGRAYIWPIPDSQYAIHLLMKAVLTGTLTLNDTPVIPNEYLEAMRLNLAVRTRIAYQMTPDVMLNGLANEALNTIRNANTQVPALQVPIELRRPRLYNILADQEY